MSESDIVLALESGAPETEVMAMHGLTFDQLDEIMAAHDYIKCGFCSEWVFKENLADGNCPACSGKIELPSKYGGHA